MIVKRADLHNHTYYSDGEYSLAEVVKKAKEKGLTMIGITDHDNVESYNDYQKMRDKIDIDVLIGVELSSNHRGHRVHIIGFFYHNNPLSKELLDYLEQLRIKRINRAKEMIANLDRYYNIKIDYEELVKKTKSIIARPHMARYIAEKYHMSEEEAFSRYLTSDGKAYVPSSNIATEDAIELLHRNNAIAIWAHPVLNRGEFPEKEIIDMGIDGIEGFYPNNTKMDTMHYRHLANTYNLLFTAGSDYHDEHSHSAIGTCYLKDRDIDKLLKKLKQK